MLSHGAGMLNSDMAIHLINIQGQFSAQEIKASPAIMDLHSSQLGPRQVPEALGVQLVPLMCLAKCDCCLMLFLLACTIHVGF